MKRASRSGEIRKITSEKRSDIEWEAKGTSISKWRRRPLKRDLIDKISVLHRETRIKVDDESSRSRSNKIRRTVGATRLIVA